MAYLGNIFSGLPEGGRASNRVLAGFCSNKSYTAVEQAAYLV